MNNLAKAAVAKSIAKRAARNNASDALQDLMWSQPGLWPERAVRQALQLRSRSLARAAMRLCVISGRMEFSKKMDGQLTVVPKDFSLPIRRGAAK